ncbi:MAG: hypothetical protein L6427_00315 [Actinomycetia bacterium]|nr:hypothetical protein [Actinomycetes bacterium]
MKTVKVSGGVPAGVLAEYLRTRLPVERIEVLEADAPVDGPLPDLSVLLIDVPLKDALREVRAAGDGADMVLVEWGPDFAGESELGMERTVKEAVGAKKVLIYRDEKGRLRAFGKALDISLATLGGDVMPEEIPERVTEAVKEAAVDNKVTCAQAHWIAADLEVPVPLVGRALDILEIKISKCQLGCF